MARKKNSGRKRQGQPDPIKIPQDHDWRTTDDQEVERRRQRAANERMRIRNLNPAHAVLSNFEVRSGSGRIYEVEIRCLEPREFSCGCVDFRSNGLGTCKHVEAVLLQLQRRHRTELRRITLDGSTRTEIVVDRAAGCLRLKSPEGSKVPASVGRWFGQDGRLSADDASQAVKACREASTKFPDLRISMEVEPWLELERRRQESVAARREYEARVQSGEWPSHETLVPLLPYQREGMLHLAFKERALLADEMGLGKTIQAIAACALLHRLGRVKRVLVISPASLKAEWEEQIRKFTPLSAQLVFGHHLARKKIYRRFAEEPDAPFFVLTNYEQAVPDLEAINSVLKPDVVILDEAQRIKNWNTKTSKQIKQIQSRFAFILTGTPIENRIDELRSLIDFLDPSVLGPLFRFNRDFYELDDRGRPVGARNLDLLHQRVQSLLLRRRKSDVANELPARTDRNLFVKLTDKQRVAYATHEQEVMILATTAEKRPLSQREKDKLQRELAMMRMICDSNHILDPEDRECPKLLELAGILDDCAAEGSKVIIFSEWERMLHLVRDHCRETGFEFAWHTGSVPQEKRRADINRFKGDPDCRILLTTDAGATGLNLQVASVIVNCDLPWNPARLEQRIARAWRKFQTRAVTVINLIAENTIEHRMLETLDTKRTLAESVLDTPGKVTAVNLRKSRKDAADRLRNLTGHHPVESGTPSNPATPPAPPDITREFVTRMKQRLGAQLVACEERRPSGGGPTRLLVVVEHVGQARTPWMESLRDEFFPAMDDGVPTHLIEVLDKATHEAIERLVKSGLLQRTDLSRRDLLSSDPTPSEPPPLSESELAALREARARGERILRRARLLGDADFIEESISSLRESLLPIAIARAIQHRQPPPATEADLLEEPCRSAWGQTLPVVESLLAGSLQDWQAAWTAISTWMQESD
jgi:hypothetical protein